MSTSATSAPAGEPIEDSVGGAVEYVGEVEPRHPRTSDPVLGAERPHVIIHDMGSHVLTLHHVCVGSEGGDDAFHVGAADVDVDHASVGIDGREMRSCITSAHHQPRVAAQLIMPAGVDVPVAMVSARPDPAANPVEICRGLRRAGNRVDQAPGLPWRHRPSGTGLERIGHHAQLFHRHDPLMADAPGSEAALVDQRLDTPTAHVEPVGSL